MHSMRQARATLGARAKAPARCRLDSADIDAKERHQGPQDLRGR